MPRKLRLDILEDRSPRICCTVCYRRTGLYVEFDMGVRICLRCAKATIRLLEQRQKVRATRWRT